MFSSLAVITEIIDLRTSIRTGFQVNTGLNTTLNREDLTRDCSYPENLHRGTGRGANKDFLGLCGLLAAWKGAGEFFFKIYFQADSVDRETETLAMCRLPCYPDHS